jgi:hypothetical protein
MPTYNVAHIREQGIELIIIPVATSFGDKTSRDQQMITADLQSHATRSGLTGTVVPVWLDHFGTEKMASVLLFHKLRLGACES